jgi:hypothetical protein
MDVGKSFQYVTKDEGWIGKLGIGAIFSLLVVTVPFLVGWSLGIVRNVMNDVEKPMPAWDNWGKLFMDGLKILVAQFIYTLPLWAIMCIAAVLTGAMGSATEVGSDGLAALGAITIGIMSCLLLIVSVVLFFLSPAIIIQYVLTGDDFGACFHVGEVWAIARNNIANILIVVIVAFVISLVLSLIVGVLALIPCIGWIAAFILTFFATPYIAAVIGHLYGQIADEMDDIAPKFS